jgi:hypothetical protein
MMPSASAIDSWRCRAASLSLRVQDLESGDVHLTERGVDVTGRELDYTRWQLHVMRELLEVVASQRG